MKDIERKVDGHIKLVKTKDEELKRKQREIDQTKSDNARL